MTDILLTIDGREVIAESGITIFQAAKKAGIPNPPSLLPRRSFAHGGLPFMCRGSRGTEKSCRVLCLSDSK